MRDVHIRSLAESMRMECGPQLSLAQRKGTTRCPWMICKGESGLDFLQSSLSLYRARLAEDAEVSSRQAETS